MYKRQAESSDKTEISKKEPEETKERLEPEESIVKETVPAENQLFKLGVKLKMLNESITSNSKNTLKRRNSLESGRKSSTEEQSKEVGPESKRRNSVGSDSYRQKEVCENAEKVENPPLLTEKVSEENGNNDNSNSVPAVVKDEPCENCTSEVDGDKNVQEENTKNKEKEVPRRRKSMEEKSGELVAGGLESGLLLARRNSLESGELSHKNNDTSKSKSSSKLDKEDAEHLSLIHI